MYGLSYLCAWQITGIAMIVRNSIAFFMVSPPLCCSIAPSGCCCNLVGCSAAKYRLILAPFVRLGSLLLCPVPCVDRCLRAFVEAEESQERLPVNFCFHTKSPCGSMNTLVMYGSSNRYSSLEGCLGDFSRKRFSRNPLLLLEPHPVLE